MEKLLVTNSFQLLNLSDYPQLAECVNRVVLKCSKIPFTRLSLKKITVLCNHIIVLSLNISKDLTNVN